MTKPNLAVRVQQSYKELLEVLSEEERAKMAAASSIPSHIVLRLTQLTKQASDVRP